MDFPTLQAELRRIAGPVQAFAAIGAALRLHQAKKPADPAVQARLLAAVEAVLPGGLDRLDAPQVSDALVSVPSVIGGRRSCSTTLIALSGGLFGTPPHFKPGASRLARIFAASSRLPLTVQNWLLRSPAAFSMSVQVSEEWRWRRPSDARACGLSASISGNHPWRWPVLMLWPVRMRRVSRFVPRT